MQCEIVWGIIWYIGWEHLMNLMWKGCYSFPRFWISTLWGTYRGIVLFLRSSLARYVDVSGTRVRGKLCGWTVLTALCLQCIYIYIYIFMHTNRYYIIDAIDINIHRFDYICIFLLCTYVYIYMYIYMCVYIYMYLHIHVNNFNVYMMKHTHTHIYIYLHSNQPSKKNTRVYFRTWCGF